MLFFIVLALMQVNNQVLQDTRPLLCLENQCPHTVTVP